METQNTDYDKNKVHVFLPTVSINGSTWVELKSLLLSLYEADSNGVDLKGMIKGLSEFMKKPVIK